MKTIAMPKCFSSAILVIGILLVIHSNCPGQESGQLLEYRFKPGSIVEYEFSGTAEIEGTVSEFDGMIKLVTEAVNVKQKLSGEPLATQAEGIASSTAFGITPDGYMLTCAHCVEGAEELTVTTPEGELSAKIIDTNRDLDLAIIKVESKRLPTVPLGKDANVELAQNVRAVGYPLSDVLGNSVKISRGAISGFVNQNQSKLYQIDVAVNPGNSGGPLVDDHGNVVGVVNAKLDGVSISKIGFSVPISYACQLLDKNKISYNSKRNTKLLSGPALAKATTPAVFFVHAELGPDGYQSNSNFQFSLTGHVDRENDIQPFHSRAIVGTDGTLLDTEGDESIPFMFTSVCELPFELLPPSVVEKWEATQRVTLHLRSRSGRRFDDDPFGMHHFHSRIHPGLLEPFGRRRGRQPKMETILGERKVEYIVKSRNKSKVQMERVEKLRSMERDSESPKLKFLNRRQLVFDVKKGVFTECKMSGTLSSSIDGNQASIPVSLAFKLTKDLEKAVKPVAKARPPRPKQNPDQLLRDFMAKKSQSKNERLLVLNRLADSKFVIEDRAVLVEAISAQAQSPSGNVRQAAARAMFATDPVAAIPLLDEELNRANRFSKRTWINKLVETQHAEAAKSLCAALRQDFSDAALQKALIKMGNVASQPVADLLAETYTDSAAAESLLAILAKVGTDDSRETLRELIRTQNWRPKGTLKRSLDKALKK